MSKTSQEMRKVYAETIMEMMADNKDVVMMDADLVGASATKKVFDHYPDQCINMGIAEANMMGVAGGLSLVGKIPFVHTFAPFATRRAYDQLFLSGAYQRANFRIIGSDPGFWAAHNGGTHTSVEDLALMRVVPNMKVVAPADGHALRWILKHSEQDYGMYYIRFGRKDYVDIYDQNQDFALGKALVLKEGKDGTIFALGEMVAQALDLVEEIKARYQLDVGVVDVFSLKPLDEATILAQSQGRRFVISFENHSLINGLGAAIAQVLAQQETMPPLGMVGIKDRFGEVGSQAYLQGQYGNAPQDVLDMIESLINKAD